jgi:hypothetical protein
VSPDYNGGTYIHMYTVRGRCYLHASQALWTNLYWKLFRLGQWKIIWKTVFSSFFCQMFLNRDTHAGVKKSLLIPRFFTRWQNLQVYVHTYRAIRGRPNNGLSMENWNILSKKNFHVFGIFLLPGFIWIHKKTPSTFFAANLPRKRHCLKYLEGISPPPKKKTYYS